MRLAWLVAASLLALGCAGTGAAWPPHLDDARQHFEDHRAELDELADFVRENGFWVVSQSPVDPPAVGYRNPEMQQNQLTPDQASYVGALLQSTGVAGATRVDSIVYLDTGVG